MNKAELNEALAVAKSNADLSMEDISIFDGFGLSDFQPVHVTIGQVARLIRYQCQQMDGGYDAENFNDIAEFGRKRFTVYGASN